MIETFWQDNTDIPSPRTQVSTRKLGAINTDLLKINAIGGETPLDGSCILLFSRMALNRLNYGILPR